MLPSETLQIVYCVLTHDDGSEVRMELLWDRDWCDNLNVQVGGYIDIDLPEMGAVGSALVTGVDLHPEIESGEGSLVTARFEHTSGHIYDLKLASEEKPIGVTGTHPVCSVDRNDWVSVADLEIDEEVKTLNNTTTVESIEKTDRVETVYNIEVEGEHVYRVGESGLLVHNVSVPCTGGVGYSSANWSTYETLYMRPQNHPNAPLTNYPITRSVNVLLDASTLGSGRSDVSRVIRQQLYNELSYFFDSSDVVLPSVSVPEQARIGYKTPISDTGGHIIPSQFGGPGTDRKNIFAQSPVSQSQYDDVWGHPGVSTQSNG